MYILIIYIITSLLLLLLLFLDLYLLLEIVFIGLIEVLLIEDEVRNSKYLNIV